MDNTNIILQLPFDESAGSLVAYDYSNSRADGIVNDASFVKGRNGNAIEFDGYGTCEVTQSVLNLLSNFTILAWVKTPQAQTGTPSKLIWLLNYPGVENSEKIEIPVESGSWYSVVLVRQGSNYKVYLNAALIGEVSKPGNLAGVSLNQDWYGGDYGFATLDDVVVYNVALTQAEIIEALSNSKEQAYLIDGINLKDMNVFVSGSDGLLNRPARKTPYSVSFDNYHGSMVDLNHNYVGERNITLSCFVKANGKMDFINKVNELSQIFDGQGTRRLVVDVHPIKPLIYEVYLNGEIEITKEWSDDLMVGTFKLKLKEPEPVKRVLKHIRVSSETRMCTITMKSKKYVNIFWGDGSVEYDLAGQDSSVTIQHEYTENGDYFPVITGCIEEIEEFSTNAIIVWNKL